MAHSIRRPGSGLIIGAFLAMACGNGDDPDALTEPEVFIPPTPEVMETMEEEDVVPVPVVPPAEELDPEEVEGETSRCVAPPRISTSPQNIPEALVLMNSLPKPTTLECFLQSLARPLSVYLTSSSQSLQPSPGARSPRTFIVNEDLVMSIVFDGEAGETLEFGFRTTQDRSIKTEILFPLEEDVTLSGLFDRVLTGSVTMCGRCHTGEIFTTHEAFPDGVYESAVIEPSSVYQVDLEALRAEEEACDPSVESNRCGMLDALFDFGEVRQSPLWVDPP